MNSSPAFPPTSDGYDDALRRTRRRRHRRHLATTSTALAATITVGVVLTAGGGLGGLTSLQQEQPGSSGGRPAPDQTLTTADATGSPQPQASPAQMFPGSPLPTSIALPSPANVVGPSTRPPAPPTITISSTLTRTEHPYSSTQPCADSSGRAATGWCVQFPGPYQGSPAEPTAFTFDLCRLPAFPNANASFPRSSEADFTLSTTGPSPRTRWSSIHQHPGHADRHDLTVTSGQCLSWHLTWWNRDDQASPMPSGRYTLAVTVAADNVGDPNQVFTQVYDYQIN